MLTKIYKNKIKQLFIYKNYKKNVTGYSASLTKYYLKYEIKQILL